MFPNVLGLLTGLSLLAHAFSGTRRCVGGQARNGAICKCLRGFYGSQCEKWRCLNRGSCNKFANSNCQRLTVTKGNDTESCELDPLCGSDAGLNSPCLCQAGYRGRFCEQEPMTCAEKKTLTFLGLQAFHGDTCQYICLGKWDNEKKSCACDKRMNDTWIQCSIDCKAAEKTGGLENCYCNTLPGRWRQECDFIERGVWQNFVGIVSFAGAAFLFVLVCVVINKYGPARRGYGDRWQRWNAMFRKSQPPPPPTIVYHVQQPPPPASVPQAQPHDPSGNPPPYRHPATYQSPPDLSVTMH